MGVNAVQLSTTGLIPNVSGLGKNLSQQLPTVIYIETSDTLATVLTTGYLNDSRNAFGFQYNNNQMALVYTTDAGTTWLRVSVSGTDYSLVAPTEGSGTFTSIALGAGTAAAPSLTFTGDTDTGIYHSAANTVAVSCNGALVAAFSPTGLAVTGAFSATTTVAAGTNVTAGSSGTAGFLQAFPATASKGSLKFVAANSAGDTITTITNASQAAARSYTIPDAGADSTFVLNNATANAGTSAGSWGNATPPTPTKVMTIVSGGVTYYCPLVAQNT